ncbi:MAG: TIGR04283 family arsenosugar biosynthesis glycosyltransferase [Bdellovibrionaceae bacterium]|nr:TIGR04283 family arsenosugar biosynthesis glycosyltransferase [Bdellovibrionales bacterium]MCB9254296.1 TIGR04283 family arsenosugar biosynthesis glycosyltransferase [Pseudobdellovibrionaceae bacterium]
MIVSVVIPTFNEVENIEGCVKSLRAEFRGELLVVDGGSTDGTADRAMQLGARLYSGKKGLAAQCNEGAEEAMGEVLFFLSADSRVRPGWLRAINEAMESPNVVGGGFRLQLDDPHWNYRLVEFGGNFRSRYLGVALSDQGLFVRRRIFERLGGFSESSLIPHALFCRRLKEAGEFVLLNHGILSSARKWKNEGVWSTVADHALTYLSYRYRELPPHA